MNVNVFQSQVKIFFVSRNGYSGKTVIVLIEKELDNLENICKRHKLEKLSAFSIPPMPFQGECIKSEVTF